MAVVLVIVVAPVADSGTSAVASAGGGAAVAIWGAGAVIFDEISRCRPDIQNKLFPIIHERKVQGITLEDLRYRWAAMNPPCIDDDEASSTDGYLGSEPLDAALADRFAFVVEMPAWRQFSERQRLAIIRAEDTPVDEASARALANAIALTRQVIASTSAPVAESVARLRPWKALS